jgi:hypothetical protein
MNRRLGIACLFATSLCAMVGSVFPAEAADKEDEADKKRAALWQALEKALPKEYQQIEAYAENTSLTAVLFRSKGTTLEFSLKTGKVKEMQHMKLVGAVNCITYQESKNSCTWTLWYKGRRELTITDGLQ